MYSVIFVTSPHCHSVVAEVSFVATRCRGGHQLHFHPCLRGRANSLLGFVISIAKINRHHHRRLHRHHHSHHFRHHQFHRHRHRHRHRQHHLHHNRRHHQFRRRCRHRCRCCRRCRKLKRLLFFFRRPPQWRMTAVWVVSGDNGVPDATATAISKFQVVDRKERCRQSSTNGTEGNNSMVASLYYSLLWFSSSLPSNAVR